MYFEDLDDPRKLKADDIVIAIMGPTGAGKSNVIDKIAGQDKRAGHGMQSCTSVVGAVRVRGHPKHEDHIVLVDTPGFNDTNKSDQEILQIIADWLKTTYEAGVLLHGIIYLHRITDIRMGGTDHRNLGVLGDLCGKKAAKKVVFVTTMWDIESKQSAVERENGLKEHYWRAILEHGASTARFDNTPESAWNVLDVLLNRPIERSPLQLQEEISNFRRPLEETKAALALNKTPPDIAIKRNPNDPKSDKRPVNSRPLGEMKAAAARTPPDIAIKQNANAPKSDKRQVNSQARLNPDFRSTDTVILVMGPPGSGKSTFINHLLGEDRMRVGNGFQSCTREIETAIIDSLALGSRYPQLKGRRLIIVDTPGFDDTFESDVEFLRRIAEWLAQSYRQKTVFGGVIYLHDISNPRFTGAARKNLKLFQQLCGDAALAKVVIGTTAWRQVVPAVGTKVESELKLVYWNSLIDKGSRVRRFEDSYASAWGFIDILLRYFAHGNLNDAVLQIQKELVDDTKLISETKVGRELLYALQEVVAMQKPMLSREISMASQGDPEAIAALEETQRKVQRLNEQIKALKIPFSRKLGRFFKPDSQDVS